MERFKSIDLMTLFAKALVLSSRMDFIGIFKQDNHYLLYMTNQASEFNELNDPGVIQVRIIIGVMHFGDISNELKEECKFQARRFNENIALN